MALLFLLLAGLGLLLVAWMLFGSSHLKYKSGMYEVVPGLKIPRPEGQGQHGTAWWMPESRYPKAFGAATLDEDAPIFRELILANVPEREKIERRNTPYESESECSRPDCRSN
ncbi:hypothetical protein SDC9_192719 [bioreactor metagenome]|uniref:Uncharacterized protein n=1 Tax=bioreactor metagenome TaxID=1076179 RepID=A0A645I313_9ZZZZ